MRVEIRAGINNFWAKFVLADINVGQNGLGQVSVHALMNRARARARAKARYGLWG